MSPENSQFQIPDNLLSMEDSITLFTEAETPVYVSKREERDIEMLERRRLLREILALSSEIHSARSSDIFRRLDESTKNKLRHAFNSVISGDFSFMLRFDTEKLKDNITRNVMAQEVAVGTMIFKESDAEGSHTVFVSHDRVDEVFWHFELEQLDAKSVTTRYVIGEYDIRKTTDGQQSQIVQSQELLNLRNSIAMIHNIFGRSLYKDFLMSHNDIDA